MYTCTDIVHIHYTPTIATTDNITTLTTGDYSSQSTT